MREMRYKEDDAVRSPPRHSGSSSRSFYSPRRGRGYEGYSSPVVDRSRGRRIEKDDLDSDRSYVETRRVKERDNLDRDLGRSRRIEKDSLSRDFSSRGERLRDYDDDEERDRFGVGARRSASPRRVVKRYSEFDRDVNTRTTMLYDYGGSKGRVRDVVGVGSSMLSDYDRSKGRVRDVVGVGDARRCYDEDLRYVDSTSNKYEQDHVLDRPRKGDFDRVKGYNYRGGYDMAGDYDTGRSGGGRDSKAGYSNGHQRLSPVPRSKPISLDDEMEKEHTIDPYRWADNIGDTGITRNKNNLVSFEDGSYLSSGQSRYLNNDIEKQGCFHSPDELDLGKRGRAIREPKKRYFETKDGKYFSQDALELDNPDTEGRVGREFYKDQKEDDIQYSRGNRKGSSFFPSISQTNGYISPSSGTFKGKVIPYSSPADIHNPTPAIQLKPGLAYESMGLNECGEKTKSVSPIIPGHWSGVLRDRSRSYTELPIDKRGNRSYADGARSERDSFTTRPRHSEEHESLDVLDSPVDRPFKGNHIGDDQLWDKHHSSIGLSAPDKLYARKSPMPERKRDLDMFGPGSPYLYNGSGSYHEYGTMKHKERHTEVVHGEGSGVLRLRDNDSSIGRIRDSPEMVLVREDLSISGPSKRRFTQEYDRGDQLFASGAGHRISTYGSGARKNYNQDDGMDLVGSSKKLKFSNPGFDVAGRASDEMYDYQQSPGRSISIRWDSSSPRRSDSRDIKERLGPRLHVSQRLENVKKPSLKDRLGPTQSEKHYGHSWRKNPNSKVTLSSQDDYGSYLDMDADHLADHIPSPEPSENSEEFKQLVQGAFCKFLKQLNETPVERRKYTKRGKVGNLKCNACGSNSDEFTDTESLVMHAFTSDKVGLRSQHLGFHKALCVLNGWRTAAVPNSVWHCEEIPDAEFEALKQDFIIWPPLMIFHNSAIGSKNPDERVVLSTEELFTMLRGRGFSNILKVCNGNPAHQGVMLVKFRGTVSGLEEAERLHKNYIDAKHGRAEFEQLEFCQNGNSIEKTPANKENMMYGYFGLAQDLDKLDPHTKKQCVLRSKREIQSIIHDPLGMN